MISGDDLALFLAGNSQFSTIFGHCGFLLKPISVPEQACSSLKRCC